MRSRSTERPESRDIDRSAPGPRSFVGRNLGAAPGRGRVAWSAGEAKRLAAPPAVRRSGLRSTSGRTGRDRLDGASTASGGYACNGQRQHHGGSGRVGHGGRHETSAWGCHAEDVAVLRPARGQSVACSDRWIGGLRVSGSRARRFGRTPMSSRRFREIPDVREPPVRRLFGERKLLYARANRQTRVVGGPLGGGIVRKTHPPHGGVAGPSRRWLGVGLCSSCSMEGA